MIRNSNLTRDFSLVLGYASLALIAQHFAYDFGTARLPIVWPASGLALVAAYHGGPRVLPAIALGAFLARMASGTGSVVTHALIAAVVAAQAGFAAAFVRYWISAKQIKTVAARTPRWIVISATLGSVALPSAELLFGLFGTPDSRLPTDELKFLWVQRWSAEAIGTIVAAPILHLWFYSAEIGTRARVLTSMILFSVLAAITGILQFWNRSESMTIRSALAHRTLTIERAVQDHMNLAFANLHAIAQLYESKGPISREEFRNFVTPFFGRSPGVRAFEWIPKISRKDYRAFEESVRKHDLAGFRIHGARAYDATTLPEIEKEVFPILFIEPMEGNRDALGYDITSTQAAKRNFQIARETGGTSLSEPITLIQESEVGQLSVVGYHPIYKNGNSPQSASPPTNELLGFVGGVFRMRDLVSSALRDINIEGLEIFLNDTDGDPNFPLFLLNRPKESSTSFTQTSTISVENQTWALAVALTAASLKDYRFPARTLMPVGSVATSAILVVLIMVLGVRSSEIEELIKLRTAELERALSIRDDFVLAISHELKTPLAPLRLQIDFLQDLIATERIENFARTPEFTQLLASLGREVESYSRLVEDLLDISKLSSGKLSLHRQACDLATIARDVADLFAREEKTEIRLDIPESAEGQWDPARLRQILTNLLSNATKYGNGKPVFVRVFVLSSDRTRIVVEDHGIGIAENDQEKIFNRFERGVNIKNYAGLGVGLFIVRELVLAHGGTVNVKSRLNVGSTFTVDLPNGPQS